LYTGIYSLRADAWSRIESAQMCPDWGKQSVKGAKRRKPVQGGSSPITPTTSPTGPGRPRWR
jgi:hypothetical protein